MRVLMITHGSRGDVQPFAALARGLFRAGHDVTLGAPAATAWLAEPYCMRVVKFHDGPNTLAGDREVVSGLETKFSGLRGKVNFLQTTRKTRRAVAAFRDDLATMAREIRDSRESFDVLLYHASVPGHHVADFLSIPSVMMCPQAYWIPTKTFPDPSFPWKVPRVLNRWTYVASPAILWAFAGGSSRWRRENFNMGRRWCGRLRQTDGSPSTALHAFSGKMLPDKVDYPPWVHVTGFWSLPMVGDWTPPKSLRRFLAEGAPPVYIGFASSVTSNPRRLGRVVAEAVRMAGARAVVVGGWSGLRKEDFGGELVFMDEVPLDWLFRHVAAVVHHGGLGTTGTALMAGVPQVVTPSFPDQWFNARAMQTLGVAPEPVRHRGLVAESLAQGIRKAANDQAMVTRASELAVEIRAENGVAAAMEIIETVVKDRYASLSR